MSDFVELRKLIGAILRMWWLILLLTVVAGVLGYVYSKSQTPIYEATATLIVGQSIQSRDLNRSQIQTSQEVGLTYADLARRYPVLNGTVESLGLEQNWQALRSQIDVALVRNTQLIEISARSTSPEDAEAIANEVARQLIILSPTDALSQEDAETRAFVQERLQNLQQRIEVGEERLQELQSLDLSIAPSEEILQSQNQIAELETLITGWESNYSALLNSLTPANDSPNYLEVIEPALARSSPVSPRTLLNTLVALILGAALGAALALLLDYLNGSVRSADSIAQQLDLPFLGEISRLPGGNESKRLLFHQDLYSRPAESYRLIRSKLQLANIQNKKSQSILFTGPDQGEGCSLTVANLGIAMSQAGLRTVIVDANLRSPKQHTLFEVENDRGLSNLLSYPDLKVDGLLKKCVQTSNLHLLNAGILLNEGTSAGGALSLTPTELFGFDVLQKLLRQLEERADVILIDSPSVVAYADPSILSTAVDGVVLVMALNRSQQKMAKQAYSNLLQAQANVYGFILNRFVSFSVRPQSATLRRQRRVPVLTDSNSPTLLPLQNQARPLPSDDG